MEQYYFKVPHDLKLLMYCWNQIVVTAVTLLKCGS